jgi:hypothetical protein
VILDQLAVGASGWRDVHPRTTNKLPETLDDCSFTFESAGVLAFDNEYSGFAVLPAPILPSQNASVRVPKR